MDKISTISTYLRKIFKTATPRINAITKPKKTIANHPKQ